jgi:hypothetical protein
MFFYRTSKIRRTSVVRQFIANANFDCRYDAAIGFLLGRSAAIKAQGYRLRRGDFTAV